MRAASLIFGACAAFLLATSVAFAQEQPDVDCDNATTQMDLNYCAGQEYGAADEELNKAYKATMAFVKDMDKQFAETDPNYVGAEAALRKAQRAWIDYRDGQCDLAGFEARGGSMEPMLVSGCLADLTRKRTEELKALTDGPEN